ncbi:MAG TPA: pyridoxamine 5'-phosphate oxidase family protein [Spirochaetota bacterium]|nr:pyridoxamine 5'-phosphate oxidase family protein [Spirochaetota bacterium]
MTKLPPKVKAAITDDKIFCLATANNEGIPNVVYVKYLKVIDDKTILIADNKMKKTLNNLQENPNAAFAVRDDESGSYQVKGKVEYFTSGPHYDEVRNWCRQDLARKGAVLLHVNAVYNGATQL